jgi:O-antigen/teichoic acid export membrane protein
MLVRALPWAMIEALGVAAMSIVSLAIVARLLRPEEFGIVALGQAVTMLAQLVAGAGIGEALVQRRTVEARHLDTAFWALLLLGGAAFLASTVIALPLAAYYALPLLVPVIAVQAGSSLLGSLNAVPSAMLARDLRVRALALRTLLANATQLAVTVTLALLGFGLWSVVIGGMAQNATSTVVLWHAYAGRPGRQVSMRHLAELLRFGIPSMLEGFAWVVTVRLFAILVGILHGLEALGYLSFALRTTDLIGSLLDTMIGRFALPVLSRLQDDRARVREAFLLGTRAVTAISAPVFLGLLVTAPDWVVLIFGPHWRPAVPLVQIICFVSVIAFGRTLVGPCLKALGRPAAYLTPALAGCAAMLAATAATAGGDVIAAGWAWAARVAIVLPLGLHALQRATGISAADQARAMLPALASAGLMAAVVAGWSAFLEGAPLLCLASSVVLGAGIYPLVLTMLDPSLLAPWRRALS